ncbi:hypothetical protein [Cellulomonas sp. NTE-D12]|uniref:hypothetical protein n=1 Tax=Cellulomonas sp. NTE-D12 TaxID=2962632 RepID=UPI0030813260|nr:TolB-like translocation protein; signal peptide [Cellulomonas sp. NTE-D12]
MRRPTPRLVALVAVVLVVTAGVGWYVVRAAGSQRHQVASAPSVASTDLASALATPHVVFRSTLPGPQYGQVAVVPLAAPAGPRAFADAACDRLYTVGSTTSCLRIVRGVATRYETDVLDSSWRTTATWPLPGIPSRSRISPDGSLVATTAFVTGHSYAQVGFSTETTIHKADGTDLGSLEDYALTVDGKPYTASDRNFWGVSFVDDDTFYATGASQSANATWLLKGSVSARTLTAFRSGGECPSISPDRAHLAYKKVVRTDAGQKVWAYAVLTLANGTETLYDVTAGCDDQIEWLDDTTILYGMARADEPGTTDVWSLDISTPGAKPRVFIPGAWSPAVVR